MTAAVRALAQVPDGCERWGWAASDAAAALVGSLGVVPSANVGDTHIMAEPGMHSGCGGTHTRAALTYGPRWGAVHGSAPDIAGRGVANPVACIRSGAMLLAALGETERAARIDRAVNHTLEHGPTTPDLGGTGTTASVTAAIIHAL
jgi:isocitrate/isopropylmalate dehydrogenase